MTKSILAPLSSVQIPPVCVVCLSPALKKYPIQQVFTIGRRAITVTVDVPMCDEHFETASFKSPLEKALGCLGIVGGILASIFCVILLFLRWVGENSLITKIFVAALAGFGGFILVWWLVAVVIAPYFAVPKSKEIRNAVRITRYIPGEKLIQLEFKNDQMAELVERANHSL